MASYQNRPGGQATDEYGNPIGGCGMRATGGKGYGTGRGYGGGATGGGTYGTGGEGTELEVGILGIAWAFGVMIFIFVYNCTAGISGCHIKPAVTSGLFSARKISLVRAIMYMVAQCLGAICRVGFVKAFQSSYYVSGANSLADGYNTCTCLAVEIMGTFVFLYTIFSVTYPRHSARDSNVHVSHN